MELFNICFLLLVLLTFKRETNKDLFSLRTCNILKGIAILGVFVGHCSKEFHGIALYKLFCSLGAFSVAVFFFISGYGLMVGLQKRGKDYHKGYLRKRIIPILTTYALACMIQWVCIGKWYWYDVLTGQYHCFWWYVYSIVWLYIMFYVAIRIYINGRNVTLLMLAMLVAYGIIHYMAIGSTKGTESMLTFIIGMIVAQYQKYARMVMGGANLLIVSLFFLMFWGTQLTAKYIGYPSIMLHMCEFIQSYTFPIMIFGLMGLLRAHKFEALWMFLQKHSLQIYLIHGIVLWQMKDINIISSELLVFIIFVITLFYSVSIKYFVNSITKLLCL